MTSYCTTLVRKGNIAMPCGQVLIGGDVCPIHGAVSVGVARNETLGELRLLVHLLDQDIRCLPAETPNLEDVWVSMGKLEALVDSMAKTKESA